jgi:hypothetical protein
MIRSTHVIQTDLVVAPRRIEPTERMERCAGRSWGVAASQCPGLERDVPSPAKPTASDEYPRSFGKTVCQAHRCHPNPPRPPRYFKTTRDPQRRRQQYLGCARRASSLPTVPTLSLRK